MLMAIYTSLRRIRPDHVNLTATRSLWHWQHLHRQHLQRTIYGHQIYKLGARLYVQAPEARPVPDDRSPPGLQREPQQQQENLQLHLSSEIIKQSTERHPKPQDRQTQSKGPTYSNMSSGVDVPYDIDWIFPRLRNPSKFWYITSQIVITIVGIFSKIVLVLLNKPLVYNRERLVKVVAKRPKGIPLITVSNHYSCFDDPGIWGVLPLRDLCNTLRIRWSMAAHDICFTKRIHALFFMYGKCIPVVRGNGVYQEAINLCIEKCALGHWVHVFPEGKVNMTKEELRLKWGVGRIIYESPTIPIILPMWHAGMDDLLPNVEPYRIQWGKKVTVNIGQPLDLNQFVQDLKDQQVPETVARKLITDKIQDAFHTLRHETLKLHEERD